MTSAPSLSTLALCYGLTVIIFFLIDIIWLGAVAKSFYANQLGDLLAERPRWGVAIVFYLIYILGIVFFASRFGLAASDGVGGSVMTAALYGAAFGFFCYATYDLTNLATLKNWPPKMVVIDIIWGTILTGSSAAIGVWATQLILGR